MCTSILFVIDLDYDLNIVCIIQKQLVNSPFKNLC